MISKLILLSVIYFVSVAGEDKKSETGGYETKYDNIDLDELLKNDRLRKNYVKCLLNEGPCTPDGLELRSNTKSHHNNPFRQITKSMTSLKAFLVRLTSRRDSHRLLQMQREAKNWFNAGDTLSD